MRYRSGPTLGLDTSKVDCYRITPYIAPISESAFMERYLDTPIASRHDDRFGFGRTAEMLASSLLANSNTMSLTLGLEGPWGSGKSSILNLVRQRLDSLRPDNGVGPVIVDFSPWLISDQTALALEFFAKIAEATSIAKSRLNGGWENRHNDISIYLDAITKRLRSYSKVVSILAGAASGLDTSGALAIIGGLSGAYSDLTEAQKDPRKSIGNQKNDIVELLSIAAQKDPTFRLVIVVDDLDRLDPREASQVLRLIKSVADFPATIYLCAYDGVALADAIETAINTKDGAAYLEKIFQFNVRVPPLGPFEVRKWLKNELSQLYPGDIDFRKPESVAVFDVWAGKLIQSPRDLKRLLYSVQKVWPSLRGKANIADFVWLQMLALKSASSSRDLYSWVVSYLKNLDALAIGGRISDYNKSQEELLAILLSLNFGSGENLMPSSLVIESQLGSLLAGIKWPMNINGESNRWLYTSDENELAEFREGKRLSSPWHWRLYFAFEQPAWAVSDSEWDALVNEAKTSTPHLMFKVSELLELRFYSDSSAADQIMEKATSLARSSRLQNPIVWLNCISFMSHGFIGHSGFESFLGFGRRFSEGYVNFVSALIVNLSAAERSEFLHTLFSRRECIEAAGTIIRHEVHRAQNAIADRILNPDEFLSACGLHVAACNSLPLNEFTNLRYPFDLLFSWREAHEHTGIFPHPSMIMNSAVSDLDFILLAKSLRVVSSSEQRGVPSLPDNYIDEVFDKDDFWNRMRNIAMQDDKAGQEARALLGLRWPLNG